MRRPRLRRAEDPCTSFVRDRGDAEVTRLVGPILFDHAKLSDTIGREEDSEIAVAAAEAW